MIFSDFENKHVGMTAIITGKGPSLDHIESIKNEMSCDNVIVMALNESIHKIESLQLPVPVYCVQQDTHLGKDCIPKNPTVVHFMNAHQTSPSNDWPGGRKVSISQWNQNAVVYDIVDESNLSAVAAMRIAKFMGISSIIFVAFDSWLGDNPEGDGRYATCIGKDSGATASPARHKVNGFWIKDCAKKWFESYSLLPVK